MSRAIRKVLVTGSSGTIGTYLCEILLEKGYDVIGADIRRNRWSREVDEVTVLADLREGGSLDSIGADVDLVVHLAAYPRVYELVKKPALALDNFRMLFNALEFARKKGVKRFLFASSREVYGSTGKSVHKEDEVSLAECECPYTATKMGGEALVHSYRRCYGIRQVIFRFSNVYGMYDDSDRVVPLFIRNALAGEPLRVFGKEKLLDFTYITDAVDGVMRAIERFDKVAGKTFNIATGTGSTLLELARLVKGATCSNSKIVIEESRTGEVVRYIANISRAKRLLGYRPKVGFEEGVRRSIEWYRTLFETNGGSKAPR